MLAQGVVCAEISGMVAEGVVFSEKPNAARGPIRGWPKWKTAFVDLLWSKRLSLKLRTVLLAILRLSDPFGRVWWGQSALADQIGCCTRTLRRLLPLLVEQRYLRVEPQTFTSLTEEQRALGLPEPERNDAGRAPNVLTLLVDGALACEFDPPRRFSAKSSSTRSNAESDQDKPRPSVARTVPRGQIVQGEPWTKLLEIPPDKMADDLSGSVLLTRKVGGDPEPAPKPLSNVDGESEEPASGEGDDESARGSAMPCTTKQEAWQALEAAYDAHYRRTYGTRPVNKCVSHDAREALATCLVESTETFTTRLCERGVDLNSLEVKPCAMLANEALRTWFAKPGGNDFLRRVSHPLSTLLPDLPYHLRNATKTQLELRTPKPEPRRPLAPTTALVLTTTNCEAVSPDNPAATKLRRITSTGSLGDFMSSSARQLLKALLPGVQVMRPRFG